MNGSDILVKMLIEQGVEEIFGVPGDTSMNFHEALSKEKGRIRHITCRDERNASYMADGYARTKGKPGVVEVPSGGGALYAVPGVSEANESSIPMICIASDITMGSEETGALTDVDQVALYKPITKWTTKIRMADKIPHLIRKAFKMAVTGKPGAVHLSVPENIHGYEFDKMPEDVYGLDFSKSIKTNINRPAIGDLEKSIEMILSSKKPVIIAGGGVHLASAYDELSKLSVDFNIPVTTSLNGKGSIEEFSKRSIGVIGANGGTEEANIIVKEADLLIVLGSKLNNVTTMGKSIINKDATIIQVDIAEPHMGLNVNIDLDILSDIKSYLDCLIVELEPKKDAFRKQIEHWNTFVETIVNEKATRIKEELKIETELVSPALFFSILEELDNGNTIYVADAGTPTPFLASYLRLKKAGRNSILPRTHGSLGYALPAAIGAKVAKPEVPVISLFGDGSFGMAVGDLETAARLKLPIVFVNFQNNSYGWIKSIQKLYYNENYYAVDFGKIDAVKIAEGFGLKGKRISSNAEIKEGLEWALTSNEPVLLDVMIEPPTRLIPPVLKWQKDSQVPSEQRKKLTY